VCVLNVCVCIYVCVLVHEAMLSVNTDWGGMCVNIDVLVYDMRVYVYRCIHVCVCVHEAMSDSADLDGLRMNMNVCVFVCLCICVHMYEDL